MIEKNITFARKVYKRRNTLTLENINFDDILIFDDPIEIDDGWFITGMYGHLVCLENEEEDDNEQIEIDDLREDLKKKVLSIIENDEFEYSPND